VFIPLQHSLIGVPCSVFSSRTNHSDPEPNWYIYHSDHLGSSAFLTDASGDPTQHLQYMPFGETFVEQRSVTSYYTPYTFSAKERDTETGYSYFGARYYDADISVWLSVDPLSDKYPSMSAYMYCAGNPVMLVDPDGREVKYNSLIDRVFVALAFVFDSRFRENYKILKRSEETYMYRHNNQGNSSLTTDGVVIYINFSITESLKNSGYSRLNSLKHEAQHAIQFEYGKIAFLKIWMKSENTYKWTPQLYDIFDEIEAQDVGARSLIALRSNTIRDQWNKMPIEKKIENLKRVDAYKDLPVRHMNNLSRERTKNETVYARPYIGYAISEMIQSKRIKQLLNPNRNSP
jgi:RHS repeat-associated protein